jgi:site-specific recombinase XerD
MISQELLPLQPAACEELPPVLLGSGPAHVGARLERYYLSVAEILERWVARRKSRNTQKAYRQDVMSFVGFLGLRWPHDSAGLFRATVADVQRFRDGLEEAGAAPKTINRRLSSVSSFYKYLAAVAAELRLPITVPNPAHAQFISRGSTDPVDETKALTATRARQLMGLPSGDSVVCYRDRAILKFYLYTGARLGTGCRLQVSDFHQDEEGSTIKVIEKGNKRRTVGLHFAAAEAISEYIKHAGLTTGPLFRARKGTWSEELSERPIHENSMSAIVMGYLQRLPGATKEEKRGDGTTAERCVYTPHSLRATTATLLLSAGVDIRKVQELLGHRHVTTTQIYDKRRIQTSQSASHDVPI